MVHNRLSPYENRNPETGLGRQRKLSLKQIELYENGEERRHVRSSESASSMPNGTFVLLNVLRAITSRTLFIVHSIATIWRTVNLTGKNSVWGFALIAIGIIFEGAYTIIMRAGDEKKWFSTSVLLYIFATAPPIWLLETKLCEKRLENDGNVVEQELQMQMLEQLLLVILIIGRWILPKGDISKEQLSQILLAYLAISSDIVEFFNVFKERVVWSDVFVQNVVLGAWTLSLLQFPFVLTVSRARKVRVAITNEYDKIVILENKSTSPCDVIYDVDMWAIILANALQDCPYLFVRLYLLLNRGLITYTMIFFTCKNALIISLQTYRAFVLCNDRYIHHKRGKSKTNVHPYKVQRRRIKPAQKDLQLSPKKAVKGNPV
uniref:Transmembrane protein 26 n=1 Tax=Syphacia muris TaxID=451379 RepID=A0A0N5AFY5_9BILA